MTAEQLTDRQAEGLRRDADGLPDVIFTSVTTMAPAAGAAFSITVSARCSRAVPCRPAW